MKKTFLLAAFLSLVLTPARAEVFVGVLANITGPAAFVSKHYIEGVADALDYISEQDTPLGEQLEFEVVDYSYEIPRAIAQYDKWRAEKNLVALQGGGTGDAEAMIDIVAEGKVPNFSSSYSGYLTDPTGRNPATVRPSPYNFFYGPSYSDGCRALVQWARFDWDKTGKSGQPKFVHVGAEHPYPEAPRQACANYAKELGFKLLPRVVAPFEKGDFHPQCEQIKAEGADYAFLANIGLSVAGLMNACVDIDVKTKFIANIWGGDKIALEQAGDGAEYYFVAASPFWGAESSGMDFVREVAGDNSFRPHHYIRGVCSVYYMKEAMEWALENRGEITGENIRDGMYARRNWSPKELEGVCLPSTWTSDDHRGTMKVNIYHGTNNGDVVTIERAGDTTLPRRDDWLGY